MIQIMSKHRRRSIRLRNDHYGGAGANVVTICTRSCAFLFGRIVDNIMRLNKTGTIVRNEWLRTAIIRLNVELDMFVVMPNHLHGLILHDTCRDTLQRAPTTERFGHPTSNSIPTIVGLFKSVTTKRVNARVAPQARVWQRNYYEHVIRNEYSLNGIRQYIAGNSRHWEYDQKNPAATKP